MPPWSPHRTGISFGICSGQGECLVLFLDKEGAGSSVLGVRMREMPEVGA